MTATHAGRNCDRSSALLQRCPSTLVTAHHPQAPGQTLSARRPARRPQQRAAQQATACAYSHAPPTKRSRKLLACPLASPSTTPPGCGGASARRWWRHATGGDVRLDCISLRFKAALIQLTCGARGQGAGGSRACALSLSSTVLHQTMAQLTCLQGLRLALNCGTCYSAAKLINHTAHRLTARLQAPVARPTVSTYTQPASATQACDAAGAPAMLMTAIQWPAFVCAT